MMKSGLIIHLLTHFVLFPLQAEHAENTYPTPARTSAGRYYAEETAASLFKKKAKPTYKLVLPDEAIQEILSKGRVHDVPLHVQNGSKCGFFALKMVMDYWYRKDSKNFNPKVEEGEPGDETKAFLFTWAIDNKQYYDKKGETNPWHLTEISRNFGYHSCWEICPVTGGSIPDLRRDVMKYGIPAIVSIQDFDSETGQPTRTGTMGGHWVIVEGFYRYPQPNGIEYMIVKHGWSDGSVIWNVADFEKAWQVGAKVCVWPKVERTGG